MALRMKMDMNYGRLKIPMFINHFKLLDKMYKNGHYNYQEYLQNKAIMIQGMYRNKRKARSWRNWQTHQA